MFSDDSPLSPRYALALIMNLPTDGAFFASRSGGQEYRGWDVDRYALVALVNGVRAGNHLQLMINRDPKKARPKAPDPFPTPGDEKTTKRLDPASFAGIAGTMMAAQRRKRELLNGK